MNAATRTFIGRLSLALLALVLAACQPATPTAAPTSPPATAAPTAVPPTEPPEPVTLTVWYLSGSTQEIEIITAAMDDFEAANPGTTVELSFYSFEDYQRTLKLAMDSGAGPDVAYGDWGPGGGLSFAKAGLLVDLKPIAEERGWHEKLGTPLPWSYYWDFHTPGHIYGIAYDYTTVGAYYNKAIFSELGLEPPTTFADLQTILSTIKAQKPDVAPISVGAGDGWPLSHVYDQINHGTVPADELVKLILFPAEGGNMKDPGFLEAAKILQEWGTAGYFQENFLAATNDDMVNLFIAGDAAIMMAGAWNSGAVATITDFEVGFFGTPPVNPDVNPDGSWHLGGFSTNNPWYINAASPNQESALQLLDHMFGPEVATALWTGFADNVAYVFPAGQAPDPVYPFQADLYNTMQAADSGYYLGVPGYDPQYNGLLQSLTTGAITPEDFAQQIGDLYERALSEAQ